MRRCPDCGTWEVLTTGHGPGCEYTGMSMDQIMEERKIEADERDYLAQENSGSQVDSPDDDPSLSPESDA